MCVPRRTYLPLPVARPSLTWTRAVQYYLGIMTATYTPTVVRDIGGATQVTWLPNAYEAVTLALAAFLCRLGDGASSR
mgnify:CR=1 FL=1